jgi:manganese/zinc/iron transport system permease protein
MHLLDYFTDPVFRGPMGGTLFLCLALSLIGVFVFFQRKSLVGEVLSHAAYPGVILGLLFLGCSELKEEVLLFAFAACVIALLLMRWLMKQVPQDLALTFTLSSFFGFGILLLSLLQFSCGYLGRLAESFFFGQAATMGDEQILHYGILALVMIAFILIFYKELKTILFDATFAKTLGIPAKLFNGILFFLTLVSIVAGIRSVGVVLISSILVAPTIAARQFVKALF